MTILESLFEVSLYGIIFVAVIVGLMIYNNLSKVKHLKGVWQVATLPIKIPILSPYVYMSGEEKLLKHIETEGDKDAGYIRVSSMFLNELYITDKNMLKELYVTKANSFEKPDYAYSLFNVFGENILSAPNAERWKKHHNICYAAFSSKNLDYMSKVATNSVDMLAEQKWEKEISKNGSYNLNAFSDFTDVTVDTLGKAGFGVSFSIFHEEGTTEEDIQKGRKLRAATDVVISRTTIIKRFFESWPWFERFLLRVTATQPAIDYCSEALDSLIKERSEILLQKRAKMLTEEVEDDSDSLGDLLSMLVDANIESKELTNTELKANALIFLLAGTETSSNTLQYIAYEMSKHKDIQSKMREEVDSVLNGRSPTFADYEKFEYLNAVIMETLRLHNIVRIVFKQTCKSNVTIGGLKVPKGTSVIPMLIGSHLSEKNWENATEFKPERFLSKEDKDRHQTDFTFTPFSMGNRKCIGYKFASIEICMVLARMLQNYEFHLLNDERIDPVYDSYGITHKPENLKIRVTRRQ